MLSVMKRTTVAAVAVIAIALVPVVVLAAGGLNGKPAASHGPKKTPAPTVVVTPRPTPSPTVAPTIVVSPPPTTAPTATAAGSVVLVGAGDIASCASTGDETTASMLDGISGTVFTLGDNVYDNGTAAEFTNCYGPSWGRASIKSRTRPVPGNHDYNTTNATGYFGYFGAAAGDPTKGYYAYDLGAWRIYVLNTNNGSCGVVACGAGSAQEQWLKADLAANPRSCVAAMWHHPRFSSGTHGNNTISSALWQDLYDAHAELILNGHDHTYERFAPQNPSGAPDNASGIVEMVVGTGGKDHYAFSTIRANSLVRDDTASGVLKLTLSAGSWTFQFLPEPGKSFTDSGSGTCH
jgi:hypothetical protein